MTRITISLPEDLARQLRQEARRRRKTLSEVVRIELAARLGAGERRRIPWAGVIRDADLVPAGQLDDALQHDWADAIDRDRR